MKKQLLLLACLFLSVAGYAQYSLTGTVLTTASTPVVGQTVYAAIDTILNPWGTPMWFTSTTTNSTGGYSFTMPATITSGTVVTISTANCTGPWMQNTPTYTGSNIVSNFTKCLPPTISGQVTLGSGSSGASNAKVYVIWQMADTSTTPTSYILTKIDSALTDGSGNYSLNYPLTYNNLLVKAFLLPASSSYSSYMPTYSTSSLTWSGATVIPSATSTGITVNVALIGGTNPGGPGFIGGSVLLGANKTTAVGDPLPNRQIILTDASDKAVAYTYSDAAGDFTFPSLAYGTYKISGDVLGKTSTPLSITLSASQMKVDDVVFQERSKSFNASVSATGISNVNGANAAVSIYPNPAKDQLTITGASIGSDVKVFDIYGKNVIKLTAGQTTEVMNISGLATGTYMVQVTDANGNKLTQKLVKE